MDLQQVKFLSPVNLSTWIVLSITCCQHRNAGMQHFVGLNKNSSGDEIADVNFLTTILHTRRPTSKYRKRDKPTSFNKLDDR